MGYAADCDMQNNAVKVGSKGTSRSVVSSAVYVEGQTFLDTGDSLCTWGSIVENEPEGHCSELRSPTCSYNMFVRSALSQILCYKGCSQNNRYVESLVCLLLLLFRRSSLTTAINPRFLQINTARCCPCVCMK